MTGATKILAGVGDGAKIADRVGGGAGLGLVETYFCVVKEHVLNGETPTHADEENLASS